METRSRICKGRPPGGELQTGGNVHKGQGKDLQQVLDESEKKRKSINTVKIKQEVLDEKEDFTEHTTQVAEKTTVIELTEDGSNNEVSNAGTEHDNNATNSDVYSKKEKYTSSTYGTSTKRRLTGSKFPKRKKTYYQDIRDYAKLLETNDTIAADAEIDAQTKQKRITPYVTRTEKIKELKKDIEIDCLQFENVNHNEHKDDTSSTEDETSVEKEETETVEDLNTDSSRDTNTENLEWEVKKTPNGSSISGDNKDVRKKRIQPTQATSNSEEKATAKTQTICSEHL